jgi:hypothetical protein
MLLDALRQELGGLPAGQAAAMRVALVLLGRHPPLKEAMSVAAGEAMLDLEEGDGGRGLPDVLVLQCTDLSEDRELLVLADSAALEALLLSCERPRGRFALFSFRNDLIKVAEVVRWVSHVGFSVLVGMRDAVRL